MPTDERHQRLRAWAKSPTTRRERVSAQEMAARLDAAIATRAERASVRAQDPAAPARTASRLRLALALAMALGAGVLAMSDSAAQAQVAAQVADLQRQKAEVSVQQDRVAATASEQAIDPKKAEAAMRAAKAAADQVADLQNQYHRVSVSTVTTPAGGAKVVGGEEVAEIRRQLEERFEPAALAPDSDFNPAGRWYTMWEHSEQGWAPADGASYQWSAQRVWTVRDAGTVDVVWTLTSTSDGAMLGWASGQFHPASGRIDHVVQALTAQGQSKVAPTDESGQPGHEHAGDSLSAATQEG